MTHAGRQILNAQQQPAVISAAPFKQFTASVSHSYRINYPLSTYICIGTERKKEQINYTMQGCIESTRLSST